MNTIKRYLGILWIVSGPTILFFLLQEAWRKITSPTSSSNDVLQWSIILGIFFPIVIGFMIFGYYGWKGEYNQPAESSRK